MAKYITAGVAALVVILGLLLLLTWISYSNREIDLRNQVSAKVDSNRAEFDNTWKIIQQKAGVTDQYKEAFKEIYPALMGERYKEGEAQLAKLVVESNPTFDTSLYKNLMDSIEAQRNIFTRKQNELIDKNLEHTNLVSIFPGSLFLHNRQVIKIPVITSQRTEEVFATQQDNNVEIFPKPSPKPSPSTPAVK